LAVGWMMIHAHQVVATETAICSQMSGGM